MAESRMQSQHQSIAFDQMTTIGEMARYWADRNPKGVALSFEGRETSYGELHRRSNQVAHALLASGLKDGDRIAYLGKNSDHYFELLIGAAKLGCVVTPIGWRLAAPEVAYILSDTGARLLFVGPECAELAAQATSELAPAPLKILMEPDEGEPGYETWRDAATDVAPSVSVEASDVAIQMYTSGTTGRPKGAMLSHRNVLGGAAAAAEEKLGWNEWREDDVALIAMPVGHVGGTRYGLAVLMNGAKGVVAREFDPLRVLDYIEQDRISKLFMVPAALQIVVRQPRARTVDYSRINCILYGASPIPLDLLRECMDVFGTDFCQQYGMTETCGTIVYLPPEDHDPAGNRRMRAAGLPMPGVELRIVGADGETLPPNVVGEVATRSIANMVGYWGQPEATAKTLQADGWLLTGDAGYLDEDGYLFIQDRVKDMIISGAENIYPAEVESAIYGHPDVLEVAVIGVPDERWGEAVKAIVVPREGSSPAAEDIIAFARSRIAAFKAPKSVDFIAEMPRNPTGKILRRELREPYWAGHARRVN